MNIGAVQSADNAATPSATGSNRLGKDEFLKLLMAQLGSQDPTSPVDNQAFVAQLAQFANVELLQAANGRLDALLVAQAAGNQVAASSLLGKDVTLRADSLTHVEGAQHPLQVSVPSAAEQVTVSIKNEQGEVVRTIQLGGVAAGQRAVSWDGLDDEGHPVPPGTYKMSATGSDVTGKSVAVDVFLQAHVDGISYANGYPELMVDGRRFKLSDVVEIKDAA
ncbi:MAG: FlgD immunoglobulin-like domain containing protein [Myxococcota bacterium]